MNTLDNFRSNMGSLLGFAKSKSRINAMKNKELKDFSIGLLGTFYKLSKGGESVAYDGIHKIEDKLSLIEQDLDFLEECTKPDDWGRFSKQFERRIENKIDNIKQRLEDLRIEDKDKGVINYEQRD